MEIQPIPEHTSQSLRKIKLTIEQLLIIQSRDAAALLFGDKGYAEVCIQGERLEVVCPELAALAASGVCPSKLTAELVGAARLLAGMSRRDPVQTLGELLTVQGLADAGNAEAKEVLDAWLKQSEEARQHAKERERRREGGKDLSPRGRHALNMAKAKQRKARRSAKRRR